MRATAKIQFDRSRHEDFEHCPRHRFLAYEFPNGDDQPRGLERDHKAMPLITGDTVHKGIEFYLNGYDAQGAVASALAHYDAYIEEFGFELDDLAKSSEIVRKVQQALAEALIRLWIYCVAPGFLEEFDILETEKEEVRDLPNPFGPDSPPMRLLARTDQLVQRKSDKRKFVSNIKTKKKFDDRVKEEFRYDSQTISEILAAEERVGKLDGVIYTVLVKGVKNVEWPWKSGNFHNNSPLIWCWKKEGQTAVEETEYASRFEYVGDDNKNHRLGKGWRRTLVSEEPFGVQGWLEWLWENDQNLLREQYSILAPIMRNDWDVEVWKRGVLYEEATIFEFAEAIRNEQDPQKASIMLDNLFPKHTTAGNCLWWTRCPMFDLCWGTAMDNPYESGFRVRVPNHPESLVQIEVDSDANQGSGNQAN